MAFRFKGQIKEIDTGFNHFVRMLSQYVGGVGATVGIHREEVPELRWQMWRPSTSSELLGRISRNAPSFGRP